MTADEADGMFAALRRRDRLRLVALAGGVALGLLVAWYHWVGVVLGGALVALPTRSFPRGVAAGLGFGALVVGAHLWTLSTAGILGPAVDAGLPFSVSLGVGVGFALLGSLLRGVF